MAARIQHRRGTAAEWDSLNPVLADGEIGFERDTGVIKVGDGVTPYLDLPSNFVADGDPRLNDARDPNTHGSEAHNPHGDEDHTLDYVKGTVSLTVGTTAPSSPALNDLWVDTN